MLPRKKVESDFSSAGEFQLPQQFVYVWGRSVTVLEVPKKNENKFCQQLTEVCANCAKCGTVSRL